MAIRFIMEVAWQAHFVKNMFIVPTDAELETFEPDLDTSHNVNCAKFTYLAFFKTFKFRSGLFLEQQFVRRVVHNFCSSGNTSMGGQTSIIPM